MISILHLALTETESYGVGNGQHSGRVFLSIPAGKSSGYNGEMECTVEGIVREVQTTVDHFVANDEPRRRTITLLLTTQQDQAQGDTISAVECAIDWADWREAMVDVPGYADFASFSQTKAGDRIRVTYAPREGVQALARGTGRRATASYSAHTARWDRFENLTQDFSIS